LLHFTIGYDRCIFQGYFNIKRIFSYKVHQQGNVVIGDSFHSIEVTLEGEQINNTIFFDVFADFFFLESISKKKNNSTQTGILEESRRMVSARTNVYYCEKRKGKKKGENQHS
jgi:hypothetical protein